MKEFEIGDRSTDGVIEILAKDSLCYQVRSVSRGATGIRTISRRLLGEWVLALEANPDKSGGEIRDLLSGRSEIDKFEYGYFATLQKMASMALGKEPMIRISRSASQIDKLQLIIYGAPGTGKSHKIDKCTDESNSIRVTFHPDTDYAAFVGSYKPTMDEQERYALDATGTTHKIEAKETSIVYFFVPQAFMKAYVEAWRRYTNAGLQGDAKTYYLVIEEISRGNCAQIFGDLFQLLDRADNGFSAYAITPDDDIQKFLGMDKDYKLADISLSEDIKKMTETGEKVIATAADIKAGKKLVLPPNLCIWATMNTSDQSLFPMDSAFKRRWDWKYVPIKDAGKGWKIKFGDCEVDWWKFLVAINKIVKGVTNSADKQLGYFFVKAKDSVIDAEMFVNKVAFYLWNDVFKDCELDGDAFKIEREGGEVDVLAFQDFFKEDGAINEEVLKNFLTKLVPQPETASGESEAGPGGEERQAGLSCEGFVGGIGRPHSEGVVGRLPFD